MVASTSLVVPSAISEVHCSVDPDCKDKLMRMSHSVSLALLFLFVVYQHYRWRSHRQLFVEAASPELVDGSTMSRVFLGIVEALLLITVLGMASLSSFFLMRTMSSVTDSDFLSKRVVSFVLLPLATDGPARIEAVAAAYNNHMTTALEFAIGRSMNVALFITPALVLFSWAAQSSYPMTLHFPTLETISIFLGSLLVAELCRDGKSDYLEGAMCLVTSVICQVVPILEAATYLVHSSYGGVFPGLVAPLWNFTELVASIQEPVTMGPSSKVVAAFVDAHPGCLRLSAAFRGQLEL
ncbi:hypothetical protein A9Z42_0013780 [Trichoderma parareesei]|uniref:Sodium/calcium exchanger membrane region domain-containing protein n=1 Tax=Trichoderma parareesei TaxID=858221 RepID=A0A2H2ZK20_TRIPA|nr:hypothetical protein A9Z42_0013780 [Trichoderma parareesei]